MLRLRMAISSLPRILVVRKIKSPTSGMAQRSAK
jgi:hypothetical protein